MSDGTCAFCEAPIPDPVGARRPTKYCQTVCQRRAYTTGLRADGLPFDLHDTEYCADESGCDRMAIGRDLCAYHHARARRRGELPPPSSRDRGSHRLTNFDREAGRADCSICGPGALLYPRSRTNGFVCAYASAATHRKSLYGLTEVQYDNQLINQGNRCALCRNPPEGRTKHGQLIVDHCHTTNAFRVLLCDWCNQALGLFQDNPETIRRALLLVE